MGLDMYLTRRYYVKNWDFMKPEEKTIITVQKGDGSPYPINIDKITNLITEEIYWRKANAIHKWFVENVQDGEDDCKEYYVSREQLQKLLETVNTVVQSVALVDSKITNGYTFTDGKKIPILEDGKTIKDSAVAAELLPTGSGFFFGGTDYDEYYVEDLLHTKRELERILAEPESDGEFYYHSSW